MKIYTITPRPFGEDAIGKEVRYIVATARARGERVFAIDCSPLSAYLRLGCRHALSALKREGKVTLSVAAERFGTDDTGAAYLLSMAPSVIDEEILSVHDGSVTVVLL